MKCKIIKSGLLAPCLSLFKSIQLSSNVGNGKGIFHIQTVNMKNMNPTRTLIGVKSGEYSKEGVVFNFCPFCGKKILKERT